MYRRPVLHPLFALVAIALALALTAPAHAAGTLTPVGAGHDPMRTTDHRVQVTIDNGFSRTEVHQTFHNPASQDLEAIFRLPLPLHASLSEMTIYAGELELQGEVLPADEAEALYEEEKRRGHDTGLGSKNDIQSFDFRVYPVRAGEETTVRFVYYQPVVLDGGVGRYLYPLEAGGTDDRGASFWTQNDDVDGTLSIEVDLRSAWPLADVRVPGFEAAASVQEVGEDRYSIELQRTDASLDTDFVVYYRLEQDLPGRVEMITHRPDPNQPGTFMMLLTPAVDLAPIQGGRDFVFVLDTSGSMAGKISTLSRGVVRAIGELDPDDRFRIVTFSDRARELGRGWRSATGDNADAALRDLQRLRADGSTNLYDGLELGFRDMDADRATSVILVTDAVTNTGVIEPKAFHELMAKSDVRVFGFLLGNSGNWPLMEVITETSGGFYAQVSNQDDILGQVLLAQEKVNFEALHDAELHIDGIDAFEVTGRASRKIYRGQQLALFGRYSGSGPARVRLDAALTGQDTSYATRFDFPAVSHDHPELERLWALARIEEIEALQRTGLMDGAEGDSAVQDLGVAYQIVTDHTSMVVMADAAFQEHGVERRNRDRVSAESDARARRSAQPVQRARVDSAEPMFGGRRAPAAGSGGNGGGSGAGAFGLLEALLLLFGGGTLFFLRRTAG